MRMVIVWAVVCLVVAVGMVACGGGGGGGSTTQNTPLTYTGNWSETDGDNGTFTLSFTQTDTTFSGTYDVVKLTNEGGSNSYTISGTRNGNAYSGTDSRNRTFSFQVNDSALTGSYHDPNGDETGTLSTSTFSTADLAGTWNYSDGTDSLTFTINSSGTITSTTGDGFQNGSCSITSAGAVSCVSYWSISRYVFTQTGSMSAEKKTITGTYTDTDPAMSPSGSFTMVKS